MKIYKSYLLAFLYGIFLLFSGCERADENDDVLSQEDISNIILKVKNGSSGEIKIYNYTLNSAADPVIDLEKNQTYEVEAIFKNGNEDETESIIAAKDEHFIIFEFQQASILLTREDGVSSTRSDGARLGLKTRWTVLQATGTNPKLTLKLIHDPVSVSEEANGNVFGSVTGGETDAVGIFGLDF